MCIIFFIITELLYKKNVILSIKLNIFYLFSFCIGYNYMMDTNKLSILIRKYYMICFTFFTIKKKKKKKKKKSRKNNI